jgi:hypothetical protein
VVAFAVEGADSTVCSIPYVVGVLSLVEIAQRCLRLQCFKRLCVLMTISRAFHPFSTSLQNRTLCPSNISLQTSMSIHGHDALFTRNSFDQLVSSTKTTTSAHFTSLGLRRAITASHKADPSPRQKWFHRPVKMLHRTCRTSSSSIRPPTPSCRPRVACIRLFST